MTAGSGKSISLNAAFTAFVQLATKGVVFLVAIVIARAFGPEDYGAYAIALTLTTVVMAATDIGLEQQFVRMVSTRPGTLPESLGAFFFTLIPLTLLAVISMPFFGSLLGYSSEALRIIELFVVYRFFNRLLYPFAALMRVRFEAGVTAVIQAVSLLAQAGALAIVIYFDWSIFDVALSQIYVAIGTYLLWLVAARHLLRAARWRWETVKELARGSLAFAPQTIAWIIYFQAGTLVLSLFAPEAEVGIYSALFRLLFVLYIFPDAFVLSCSPVLYRCFRLQRPHYDRLVSFANRLMIMVALVATYLLAVAGEQIIALIYGEAFVAGLPMLHWLLPAILFRIMSLAILETLTTSDHQRFRNVVLQVGLLANIGFSFALAPELGGVGVAMATSAAELLMLLCALGSALYLRLPVLTGRADLLSIAGLALLLLASRLLCGWLGVNGWWEFLGTGTVSAALLAALLWQHRRLLQSAPRDHGSTLT